MARRKKYRFNRREAKVLRRGAPLRGTASSIVRTDLVDFTQVTDIQSIRPPTTPPGKGRIPRMNGDEKLIASLSLNFFLDARGVYLLRRKRGKSASILDVRLVNFVGKSQITVASATFSFDSLTKGQTSGLVPVNLDLDVDLEKTGALRGQENKKIPGRTSRRMQFVFTLFRSSGRQSDKIGSPISKSSFSIKYNMEEDLDAYYVVTKPVEITAAATAFDQSLVTLYKPADSTAETVNVYRRKISPDGTPGQFIFVKEVDFAGESDTLPGEGYTEMFVDGNLKFGAPKSTPEIDNVFAHQYRAIPVGKRGAQALTYRDAFTEPISQASVSIGDNFRILPVFQKKPPARQFKRFQFGRQNVFPIVLPKPKQVPGAKKPIGFQLTDDNFLSPDVPMVGTASDLSVVTYLGPESVGGITVSVTGKKRQQGPVAIDFVRRDITANEKNFTLIPAARLFDSSPQQLVPQSIAMGDHYTLNFTDTAVIDGHSYEYAVRSYNAMGVTQLSDDKSRSTYRDPRLLPTEGITLRVQEPELTESNTVKIELEVSVPQNVVSLLNSLLNNRVGPKESPFSQDIIDQRKNLSPQPSPVIRRIDTITGEEISFKLMGNTAEKFETPEQDGVGVKNVFKFTFIDANLIPGSKYFYEVFVNLRDPLSVTDEVTSVVSRTREPYIFQSCKFFNPLFTSRGILPPTARGQDFILQRNIESGRDRLLNRFSPDDAYDLGRTGVHSLVPESPITIAQDSQSLGKLKVEVSRVGGSVVSWAVRGGTSNIDHFKVFAIDSYIDSDDNTMQKRSLVGLVPAQGASNFKLESHLGRLDEEDISQFVNPDELTIDIADLQRLVDLHQVSVTRIYEVSAVGILGMEDGVQTSDPIEIWSSFLGNSVKENEIVEFIESPAIIFEGAAKKRRRRRPPKPKQQAFELIQSLGKMPRLAPGLNLQVAKNLIANPRLAPNIPQVVMPQAPRPNLIQPQILPQLAKVNPAPALPSPRVSRIRGISPRVQARRRSPQPPRRFGQNAPAMQRPSPGRAKNQQRFSRGLAGARNQISRRQTPPARNMNFGWRGKF